MASRADRRHQQHSDEVRPEELVEMFRLASKTMPVPSAAICADCTLLRSRPWVKALIVRSQEPWETAEREALDALKTALRTLPEVIQVYRKVANIAPFDARRLAALVDIHDMLPAAIDTLQQSRGRATEASLWHLPAEVVALHAMTAWRRAGWTEGFGCAARSPLVRFTKTFLERAGEHRTAAAIAAAFERGGFARLASQATKSAEIL